jgi:DNA-binding response OmpR family regulator
VSGLARRILIVEDYPPLAKVIAIAAQRAGYAVERVGNVTRALEVRGRFDLAIVDLDLPDGLGTDLVQQLLDDGRLESAVFFSSTRDAGLRLMAARLGPVVDKEAGLEELMAVVQRRLDQGERLARAIGDRDSAAVRRIGKSGARRIVRRR